MLRPLLRRPSMVWKRPEIFSFVYRPAAGEGAGLAGMSQVASAVMVAITPAMSLAVKRAKSSIAAFLFCSVLMPSVPSSRMLLQDDNLPEVRVCAQALGYGA